LSINLSYNGFWVALCAGDYLCIQGIIKMFIDEKELLRRINSTKNLVNTVKEKPAETVVVKKPLREQSQQAPEGLKIIAASLIAQGEKPADVQQAFNLSAAQVNAEKSNPAVARTLDRVRELALDKMLLSLGLMTQDKFDNASLRDLSHVAADLSRVIERTTKEDGSSKVQFILHVPETKSIAGYKVIDV